MEPEEEPRNRPEELPPLLFGQAAAYPLMVGVEDVHWADQASLDLLLDLARQVPRYPVLLALTYRPDESHAVLAPMLAELDRERVAVEIELQPLSAADVQALLRALVSREGRLRQDVAERVFAVTEGNPFFVEEVARSLADDDLLEADESAAPKPLRELRIPRSVDVAVRRRSERLSAAAQHVLACAAVAGRRFDFALLQNLTELDEAELLRCIKETIAAQLVVEESAEWFGFRHALTRQAVLATLLARERKALHRLVAEHMERLYAGALDPHLADLSEHWFEAEEWDRALELSRRAGERAQELHAPRAAVELFSRALSASDRLGGTAPVAILRRRGLAYETLGEFERARADYLAAVSLAAHSGDSRAQWQGLLDLGSLWSSRDYDQTREYYVRALEIARGMNDPPLLAESLNRVGNWHTNLEELPTARGYHEEALATFRSLDDRRGVAATLDLLGMVSGVGGDLRQGLNELTEAAALLRELDEPQLLVSALSNFAVGGAGYETLTLSGPVPFAQTRAAGAEAVQIARDMEWRSGESFALMQLADVLGPRGEYGQAIDLAWRSLEIAEEIGHHQWTLAAHLVLAFLCLDMLAFGAARDHLESALVLADEVGSRLLGRFARAFLALTYVEQAETQLAERALEESLTRDSPMRTLLDRLNWTTKGRLALARGDANAALLIADALIETAARLDELPAPPVLLLLRGQALALLHRANEAETALREAAERAAAEGLRPLEWRSHAALGSLLRTQRHYEQANAELAAARTIVDALAAGLNDQPLRDELLRHAAARLASGRPPSSRRAAKQAYGGLTAREREVAALIASGKKNREIAEALVVSQLTVATHVSSILLKLNFVSRSQVAAWAVERGLATSR
jgi:DNA-binding CsgD family transcriptional regulator